MQTPKITQTQSDIDLPKILTNNFSNLLILIFYAEWNGKSKQFIHNLQKSIPVFGLYDNVRYVALSAEKCPLCFGRFQVEKTPTVIFTGADGKILKRLEGDQIGVVFDWIGKVAEQHKVQFDKNTSIWYPQVKRLIQDSPITLISTGTPQTPQSPQTKTIIQLLDNNQIEYSYHNILENQQLSNWIAHYTKSSDYPALYINGKLVGGVDTIRELMDKGQFLKILPESCRKLSVEERYNKFVDQCENVVFVDGYTFENQQSRAIQEIAYKKYGENFSIFNVAFDRSFKTYIVQKLGRKLPFIVHNKNIIE